MSSIIDAQKRNLSAVQGTIDELFDSIGAEMSQSSSGLIKQNTQLSEDVDNKIDSYLEDRDEGAPIEDF